LIAVATLYAPIVLALSYFFDATQIGVALFSLSALNIVFLKISKSHGQSFFLPFIVLFCSIFAFLSKKIEALQYTPLLISIGFLLLFIVYSIQKKSIPLEATIKFRKKELTESEKIFLLRSHNWWLLTLAVNTALHIYFIALGDMALWAAYASVGWYLLFGVSIAVNIIIGKLVVQKNSI